LEKVVVDPLKEDAAQLMHMGAATALAIAIHNFPEGLVTFVAYTQDPTVGIVLAIGIGIHNIPEGLCVAMPIFYATGNRWKAFMWAILSGVSEPLGAVFGYAVLKGSMSGNTYGIMFGLVAGIMTLIAADELLPTAHRYDTKNEVVTYAFIFGMLAIAMSLVIFSN
jgi:zinc transporter, ZIP family